MNVRTGSQTSRAAIPLRIYLAIADPGVTTKANTNSRKEYRGAERPRDDSAQLKMRLNQPLCTAFGSLRRSGIPVRELTSTR